MFNQRTAIKELISQVPEKQEVTLMGWIRNFRNNQFLNINDDSCSTNIQIVLPLEHFDDELIKRLKINASVKVTGALNPIKTAILL